MMKILKPLGLLMGIGTILSFNIVNPIHAETLASSPSETSSNIEAIDSQPTILAGNFNHNRGFNNSRHGRGNRTIIVVPGAGNNNFYNGNMRRNNTYWNNNNRNVNQIFPHNQRDIYQGNIHRNRSNFINQNNRSFRRSERQCIHRVFQSAWGEIHCRSNNPSFEWRTVYFD